jgi:hypothetical protein
MFDVSNIIILVTGTTIEPYAENWRECERTWIPELRKIGYKVMIALGNPDLETYYKIEGDTIWFKAEDTKEGLYDKSIRLPIKWILEETNYQYYFRIDSDSFVAPKRFHLMVKQNLTEVPTIDYMGCIHPYDGFNPHEMFRFWKCYEGYMASGCGYMISRNAMKIAQQYMRIDDVRDYTFDDWVLGRAMWENKIYVFHDSRILFESKYKQLLNDSNNIGTPDITEPESHLAIQHYMNGYMEEAMVKLGYRNKI